ncbi:P-loop containing nucleoside triphosphate hydrolase protein [Cyathus striatus]|nr:P-loop containing nucleoside triphosphate hydrolase protein [Cyathus striatus]
MPRRARIHFVSLHSSLVNLPISIYGPLLERGIRPQGLAVHLILVRPDVKQPDRTVEAYVGWTGMASASSLAQFSASHTSEGIFETIDIDPQYAQGLGLSENDIVEIGLLYDMQLATSVATEPLTSDDWEIIEIHASHVESTLLSQVRVAKVGQEIDVWVLGRTRVRLRVVSISPSAKDDALLLTTNTEVSIAAKLHQRKENNTTSASKPVQAAKHTSPSHMTSASTKPTFLTKAASLRVLPSRLLSIELPDYSNSNAIAFVSPKTFKRIFPKELTLNIRCYKASIKRMPSPKSPSSNTSASSAPAPGLSILNTDTSEKGKDSTEESGVISLYLGCKDGIVDNHIVFPVILDGVEEWDVVVLSSFQVDDYIDLETLEPSLHTETGRATTTRFLAGVSDILARCTEYCVRQFTLHSYTNDVRGASSLLVTGRSGTGKTSISQAVARALEENSATLAYTHYVDVSKYAEQPAGVMKQQFNYWFDKAAWHKPSVLILDNLDKLLGPEHEHADSFRSRHLTELFLSLFSSTARTAAVNFRGIILIVTATSTAALHPLLNSTHVFKEVVHVQAPNKNARRDILKRIVEDRLVVANDITQDPDKPLNFTALATQTEGYSATDLQDLVARAVHQVAIRAASPVSSPLRLTSADFSGAQAGFVPLSLRDVKLQKSDVVWSDIGGMFTHSKDTKRVLRETLEWPTKYGPIFAQSPLRLRSGLLLYGYPGCGKTLLASAVAKECGLNFISVKGPEILNKYIGASEQSVRELFERASAAKPCVLFFDEFDSIAPKRGHDSTGVTDRVVNQMLTQMDGAEGLEGVYVLAATSRPDLIDSALLRPGRLDKSLLCDMPNHEERRDILLAVSKKVPLSASVDLDWVAEQTEGYSGADIQALLYNAHLEVVHASIPADVGVGEQGQVANEGPLQFVTLGGPSNEKTRSKAETFALEQRLRQIKSRVEGSPTAKKTSLRAPAPKMEISDEHVRHVLRTTRPSVPPEERYRLKQIYMAFVSDRSGDLPIPPDAGGVGNRVSLM